LGLFRLALERRGMHSVGKDVTDEAVKLLCRDRAYHPVRDWLDTVQHDGQPRLGTWLTAYLGAEDAPLVRAIGRAFLIAMVARVMIPGAKHAAAFLVGVCAMWISDIVLELLVRWIRPKPAD
jgi:predicted P-loop ATPase